MREKAIRAADQELEDGLKQIAEQGGGEAQVASPAVPVVTSADATSQRGQSPNVALFNEPTQNINIPIPLNQHMRLAVIKAHTRQNIKDLVVQAIALWLDVQEGKKKVSATT